MQTDWRSACPRPLHHDRNRHHRPGQAAHPTRHLGESSRHHGLSPGLWQLSRGYSYRVYPWGDHYDGTQSGTPNGEYAAAGTHPLDVSPFGVRGMAGNVWEWCADFYQADTGHERVLRGCGWNYDPDTFRCAYRSRLTPTDRSVHIGFRIVKEP